MKTEARHPANLNPDAATTQTARRPAAEWYPALVIAALLAALYYLTAQPPSATDGAGRLFLALTAALATEGSLTLDNFITEGGATSLASAADAAGAAYFNGHYFYGSAPGGAWLAVPFYQLGRGFGPDGPAAFALAGLALAGAGTALALYAAARRLGSAVASARYATLMLALTTALWRQAGHFGPGVFSLLLLALALWLVFRDWRDTGRRPFGPAFALGLALGLAATVDYANLLWAPLFGLYLLAAVRSWRVAGLMAAGWLAGLAPLGLYNWLALGRPWTFTYGFGLDDSAARSLTGQFLGGFQWGNLREVLFGPDRALLGLFVLLFGVWGLLALYGQRGKRRQAILLLALVLVSLLSALLRRPAGQGILRADLALGMLPPLAIGTAVWHERFLFLTRLEQWWLPALALVGAALYYWLAAPGPLANLSNLEYLFPLALLAAGLWLAWNYTPRLNRRAKAAGGLATLALLGLVPALTGGPVRPSFAFSGANNLLYNPGLECRDGRVAGWFLDNTPLPCAGTTPELPAGVRLKPYLAAVQGGHVYEIEFAGRTGGQLDWLWLDEGHNPVDVPGGNFTRSAQDRFEAGPDASGRYRARRAAPPGAAYLQAVLTPAVAGRVADFRLNDAGIRVEPLKNYATAALAFTFDWESAMGGLIHSKGGAPAAGESEGGGLGLTGDNLAAAVRDAERRGLDMRKGADFLLDLFAHNSVRGTFYGNGYNLLDGNPARRLFANNPTYKWASPANGWSDDFWTRNPWFRFDPYAGLAGHEAWYFGDQTDRMRAAGQDIQSHTFGHVYVRGTSVEEFRLDTEEFLRAARAKNLPPVRHFAFPWKSSNSVRQAWYAVLAGLGFQSVTRLYDPDQRIRTVSGGRQEYDNGRRDSANRVIYEPQAGPDNPYFYLSRVRDEPRLAVLHDYQLVPGAASEAAAGDLIDELLRRRGYGSIWTHPEAIVSPEDQAAWTRLVEYAVRQRQAGLWVESVSGLLQHRQDAARLKITANWQAGGRRLTITLTNPAGHPVEGLTLTLPAPVKSANGAAGFRGAQLVAPELKSGRPVTIVVELA